MSDLNRIADVYDWQAKVIGQEFCIGCGACAVADENLRMQMSAEGLFQPAGKARSPDVISVCPFSSAVDETELANNRFQTAQQDVHIGRYLATYAGHVSSADQRSRSSSGGISTFLLKELLRHGEIDGVIQVKPKGTKGRPLYNYGLSTTEAEIDASVKSRYYPSHFEDAFKEAMASDGAFAFVGVPCQVKAARLLVLRYPELKKKIVYFFSIFCGHMKSAAFGEYLGWQMGVHPNDLIDIDFRKKSDQGPANNYLTEVRSQAPGGFASSRQKSELHGTDWGLGLFKPKACDYCDDIAGECADFVSGDAWLRPYLYEPKGTSVIIVRHPKLDKMLAEARADGRLALDDVTPEDIHRSQAGNYRHRWEGLSHRLFKLEKAGKWHPHKRIAPRQFEISWRRRQLYELRTHLSQRSHQLFAKAQKKNDWRVFRNSLKLAELKYYSLYGIRPFLRHSLNLVKTLLYRKRT